MKLPNFKGFTQIILKAWPKLRKARRRLRNHSLFQHCVTETLFHLAGHTCHLNRPRWGPNHLKTPAWSTLQRLSNTLRSRSAGSSLDVIPGGWWLGRPHQGFGLISFAAVGVVLQEVGGSDGSLRQSVLVSATGGDGAKRYCWWERWDACELGEVWEERRKKVK